MPPEVFSVTELNTMIRHVLEAGFPRAIWVCGEVQNYDRGKSKPHAFFELVEKSEGSSDIKARIGLVIWANTRPKIDAILKKDENAFEIKDDIEAKFLCRVDFYPGFGQVRLIVESIDPVYTLGKIAQDRQKLIAELTASGTLGKNKQIPLSPVPLHIGLITAFDSAAHNDLMDELLRSHYGFTVHLARAVMQGKNCAPSVCEGLRALNAIDGLDAIVITRGGGSIAELACFDSRDIALAVAASRYPVISGIGHEINTSVTDLAAHTVAKTPTAAAQFLVTCVRDFLSRLNDLQTRLKDMAFEVLHEHTALLKDIAIGLQAGVRHLMGSGLEHQATQEQRLSSASLRSIFNTRASLIRTEAQLKKTFQLRLGAAMTKIGHYQKLVSMASPRNVLRRGFSVTRGADGKALRSADTVKPGEKVRTELMKGEFTSIVQP